MHYFLPLSLFFHPFSLTHSLSLSLSISLYIYLFPSSLLFLFWFFLHHLPHHENYYSLSSFFLSLHHFLFFLFFHRVSFIHLLSSSRYKLIKIIGNLLLICFSIYLFYLYLSTYLFWHNSNYVFSSSHSIRDKQISKTLVSYPFPHTQNKNLYQKLARALLKAKSIVGRKRNLRLMPNISFIPRGHVLSKISGVLIKDIFLGSVSDTIKEGKDVDVQSIRLCISTQKMECWTMTRNSLFVFFAFLLLSFFFFYFSYLSTRNCLFLCALPKGFLMDESASDVVEVVKEGNHSFQQRNRTMT